MAKPISQLIPDFREALKEGLEEAVENVVGDLIEEGPYWSGLFASYWMVRSGQTSIPTVIPRNYPVPRQEQSGKFVKNLLPNIPKNNDLEGYTLGNMTEYRGYAMDLLPTTKGRQMGNAPNATAKKDWFLLYVHAPGGGMGKRINDTLTNVFKKY